MQEVENLAGTMCHLDVHGALPSTKKKRKTFCIDGFSRKTTRAQAVVDGDDADICSISISESEVGCFVF